MENSRSVPVRSPHGVINNMLDSDISQFKLQSCYYLHFQTNNPWEIYEPLYSSNYSLNSTTIIVLQRWLWY